MMVVRRKKGSKIKTYILFILIVVIGFTIIENKKFQKRLNEIYLQNQLLGVNIKRTKVDNIFLITENGSYTLYFVTSNEKEKRIEGLKNIGEISLSTPILIQKDKYGYVDKYGEIIIPLEYEKATNFKFGIASVKKNKYGVIDEEGNVLLPFEYEEMYIGEKRKVIFKKDGKYYISNLKSAKEIDVDKILQLDCGKLLFKKDKEFGIIDFSGEILKVNKNPYILKKFE
ncbi:WG repeat-containing protein [Fusobacterium sp.]|uniref:WG repeat-containing protein n=1 Tax=Fusobacterium sp. TaxID=68766 RepID=UPI002631CD8D|nr:WG repeat-containing protein [Fusobacterium sp.]